MGAALAVLTVAGHTAAQGSIDAVGVVVTAAISVALGLSVTRGPLGFPRLLAFLLAGQALLHVVLAFASAHSHGTAVGAPSTAAMVAGHVLAAIVAAMVVCHADGLMARWSALLGSTLGWSRPVPVRPARPMDAVLPYVEDRGLVLRHLDHRLQRRGPPEGIVLAPT